MTRFGIGQSVRRKEDQRLLLGRGRFVDDLVLARMAHAVVVRSPHAHADILAIDLAPARRAPGVLAVASSAELEKDGIHSIPALYRPPEIAFSEAPMPILARGRVRHVGEPVVFVVAQTLAQARDAAERVEISYRPLPASADVARAMAAGTPRLHDSAPDNRCYRFESGDEAATEAAFRDADLVVRAHLRNNRLVINAIEPRAAIGDFVDGRLVLYANSQVPHRLKSTLAEHIFRVPEDRVRVLIGDVGGGFGAKNQLYPEHILVLWAARALGRPVKWLGTNTEGHVADIQGRDHDSKAELALDKDGTFRAIRVRTSAALGAYVATNAALIPTVGRAAMCGPYRIGAGHIRVDAVFANTTRTDAYRGAGSPEANYLVERLVDRAARTLGVPAEALRRKNLLTPADLPHTTPSGYTFDVGDFPRRLDQVLAAADATGFQARRRNAEARGRLRGLGIASTIEAKAGGMTETTAIRFDAQGRIRVLSGMMANGQGHATTFAQIVADKLGLDWADIEIVQSDTDAVATGLGTAGSRSLVLGGSSLMRAAEAAIEKGLAVAGQLLEAAVADLIFENGAYAVAGTDRRVRFAEVARVVGDPRRRAPGMPDSLDSEASFDSRYSFPNASHVAEVEIDPETGQVALLGYAVAQDSGTIVNPMIVEGQMHGGLVQGIGQALMEHAVYDAKTAQPLSGSLLDYALPRADDVPMFAIGLDGVPAPTNPLGAKGVGETGCTGAPPAVMNAFLDALAPLGVEHIDMPATPESVWRANASARG